MNQLGKNVVLSLCVVATLLVILGLKRKFGGGGEASLLAQPSEEVEQSTPKSSPRPRVLQAKPIMQHDRAILSPTSPQYTDSEFESSHASGVPGDPNPIPTSSSPRPGHAPELVPVGVAATSPITDSIDDEAPEAATAVEPPLAPVPARPLPDFVLTDSEDSFWSISERVYGSGTYYRALFRHNEAKVLRPDQLRAGIEVRTPALKVLRELYPADFPKKPSSAP